jgi:hypothetical protein
MADFRLDKILRVAALFGFIRMISPIPYKPQGLLRVSNPVSISEATQTEGNLRKGTEYSYRSNHRRAGSPVLL